LLEITFCCDALKEDLDSTIIPALRLLQVAKGTYQDKAILMSKEIQLVMKLFV